ncbi:MAG: ABC transporter ATP-binding protein [Butyrivibrio sp.]|nr:ABC transporter ATP-binding protein [Butyrivibrio sp.]
MIEAIDLSYEIKKGKDIFAIKNLSMKLEKGYISCLLGHNGAGKTTLMQLLFAAIKPDGGRILYKGDEINSKNLHIYHEKVAFVGMEWCVKSMTIRENMAFLGPLYPDFNEKYFDELAGRIGILDVMDKTYGDLSKGQRAKAEIVFAIARNPEFIFLDEPLANLDPVVKTELVNILVEAARDKEIGILLSTHLLEEVSDIVDYVVIMENGEIIEIGDRETIFEKHGASRLREIL